ncbi:MAG: DUF3786 domain-containing protein, partial [Desulfobacterales bacterium]
MEDNYTKIVNDNLTNLYKTLPDDLARALPGDQDGKNFMFEAFGERCEIRPNEILLGKEKQTGVVGILISLYALYATTTASVLEPLQAFKDFPNSMPYAAAFVTHTQQILVPYVADIITARNSIMERLKGQDAPHSVKGDDSFVVYPLPKIALCYIFYEADEDFPASATC